MKKRIIISGVLVYTIISILLLKNNITEPSLTKYDIIIVLGNSPNFDNRPNPFLKTRLNTGIEFLKEGYSNKIILSGAKKESQFSEAEIMKRYCMNNRISSTQIIIEDLAKSTKENLINSVVMMKKWNLKKALVITSSHHTKRTKKYCELLSLKNFEVVSCKNNLFTGLAYIPLMLLELHKINQADI